MSDTILQHKELSMSATNLITYLSCVPCIDPPLDAVRS